MQAEHICKTGGQVDELTMALIDAANDKQIEVRQMIITSLHEIGKKQSELVLSTIKAYLVKHQKLHLGHRMVLLKAASRIIKDTLESLPVDIAKQIVMLASAEMTRNKEVEPEWQSAASEVLVALGGRFDHEVMAELLEKLVPGNLPHYFVVQTLASLSSTNAFGVVPFLKDILGRMLPMLGMAKHDNMKWVFANCLARFSESILDYVANIEAAPYPDITLDRFYGEIFSAFDVLFNVWLKSNEPKIRLTVVSAVGHMSHIMAPDKLGEQLSKILAGLTGLYKRHTEHYQITQGLCMVLDAACRGGGILLSQHLDTLLNGLHGMVCNLPDFSNPVSFKNHNEVLRCFSVITPSFSDRVIGFLLMKMETNTERTRLGSLAVLKHLINSSGSHLENKEGLIVTGVQILLSEQNLKVRSLFAQAITAMAHHRYLELEGGQKLVEFIVLQCALEGDIEKRDSRRPIDADTVTPRALRSMCENILHLITTTVAVMETVLWPSLLECVVPEPFTNAMTPLCRSLSDIASKKREEEAEDFMIDFEIKTNIPKPAALVSRLLVMTGHPSKGRGRGIHVLKLMKALCPILKAELVEMWDTVIPKLLQYIEENLDDDAKWNQKAWEDLVLKLLSKSLDEVDSEDWVLAVGSEMGIQIQLYSNLSEEKNFLYKCMGIVLRKATNKSFIQAQLNAMFSAVKHSSQVEQEGCAIGFGFCAGTNLDDVLAKLEMVSKNEMVRKSTGLLGFKKDKSESDAEKIKSTVMLCYGYSVLYAPPSHVSSRLETNVMRVIGKHFNNVKDAAVKHNLIRTTELIGKALEPSRLQEAGYTFTKRGQLVSHMLAYIKSESTASITTETRALAMDACASLAKLHPGYNDAEIFDIVKTSTDSVFPVQTENPGTAIKNKDSEREDPASLQSQALESLNNLLKQILLRAPVPYTLQAICKHIEGSWLLSAKDVERERAVQTILVLLNVFKENLQANSDGKPMGFSYAGQLLARLVPRCTDPVITIRQVAIESVQILLRVAACFEGYSLDSKDEHLDALSTLKQRAAESDANILFSVASDLSKVVAKKLQNVHLPEFTVTLLEGLTDCQSHSASGSCVVLNSIVRIRGQELRREVDKLVFGMHEKLCYIAHQQTRTGTLRVFRTIASHHLVPLLTAILQFPLPFDEHVVEIWKTLAGESSLALSIFNYLLDLLTRTAPYLEKPNPKKKKETVRVATFQPTAINCGLTEMLRVETITELALEHFHRLFSSAVLRLGISVALLPPENPNESTKDHKSKSKVPRVDPQSTAVACMKQLLVRCKYDMMEEYVSNQDGWALFENQKTYPDGISLVARALCCTTPQQIPKLADHLNPSMSSAYDDNRIVVAALFAELIDQRCGGHHEVVELLMNSLLGRLVDSSLVVRKFCIRGLGNMSSVQGSQIERYSTTILSAMMAGMDDRDDLEDEITLESMSGLAKILAKLDENNVRQILINICLRIRPCFEKEKAAVRAAAFTLFGRLSRFADGPSKAPCLEQVHTNFISILLHLNEEPEVARACKTCLRSVGPLMKSESIDEVFQKHLLEEGQLHYGEFINTLSRLIIADFPDKMSFYVMGCVSFFKSSRGDIKANAALFVGFILGNLPRERRDVISKDHVCGALILLLKDPSTEVRSKAAEAMSLLFDY